MDDVILATIEYIPGYRIVKVLGVVTGNTVRARHIGRDIVAALRNIVGGEIREYSELLESARSVALEKLKEKAKKMGANAVVGIRFSTSSVMAGAAEILAYGTAVVVEKAE
ncbi:MAG TPA: YbjQ family protein [Pyrodictium sp.]|nr:YbjQ family protein [Pyrodictium sp.]HIP85567.1 YbjQ family protein [Pyrodictium sp.]